MRAALLAQRGRKKKKVVFLFKALFSGTIGIMKEAIGDRSGSGKEVRSNAFSMEWKRIKSF